MTKRVLIGCFSLEANAFVAGLTSLDDFSAGTLAVGGDIVADILGPSSELAAAWAVLEGAGYKIEPSVVAWIGPRPPLSADALDEIERLMLSPCDDRIDGVYLMLHGGASAAGEGDPEGRILTRLRERLGHDKVVVVSLDHHAHVTARIVAAVDGVAAYRTCPHTDAARTGAQAARLLVDALEGRTHPVVAMAGRPMITPPQYHDNAREPFGSLMRLCDEVEASGVLAAALLPVTPWLDVPDYGWKAVVTADGDRDAARDAAERIMAEAWAARHELIPPPLPTAVDALGLALEQQSPTLFADTGDTTNGGSTGDSTELLRAALELGQCKAVLLSICDIDAAALAHDAGIGAAVDLRLGRGAPGTFNQTIRVGGRVEEVFDGEYWHTHPVNAGYRAETGKAARVSVGAIQLVVHSRIALVIDPALYLALGADPAAADVVQAKSHVSYRAGFDHLTPRSVVAGTAGPTSASLERLPYRYRPVPLFPLEEFDALPA